MKLRTIKDIEHRIVFKKDKQPQCALCGALAYYIDGFMPDGISPCKIAKCPNDNGEFYLIPILKEIARERREHYKNQIKDGVADDDYVTMGRIQELNEVFNLEDEKNTKTTN